MRNNKTRAKLVKAIKKAQKPVKTQPQVLLANDGHVSDLMSLDEFVRSKEFLTEYYGN